MITIDCRWINTSGIGTYLRNVIPAIVSKFSHHPITLLGDTKDLKNLIGSFSFNCNFVQMKSRMYSIEEQLDYAKLIPNDTTLYFSTHYNVPLFYSGRMIVTVYDTMHLAMPQFVHGFHKRLYAKLMFSAVRRKADSILTISEFTRNEMIRLLGDFRQPITPIHLGVSAEWFSINPSPPLYSNPYILYVGNIKPHKNLKTLIRAFISIAEQVPHNLVLVGKKEGFITGDSEVANMAKALAGRIHFTGHVSDEELHQHFHHAEAFIFPSLYEGFGLPPLEAMAAGCPVLVSNAGSLPEVCGDAALYFDPLDETDLSKKLLEIINNKELRNELRNRGYARGKTFTWERCVSQTCDVIEKLLETPAGN